MINNDLIWIVIIQNDFECFLQLPGGAGWATILAKFDTDHGPAPASDNALTRMKALSPGFGPSIVKRFSCKALLKTCQVGSPLFRASTRYESTGQLPLFCFFNNGVRLEKGFTGGKETIGDWKIEIEVKEKAKNSRKRWAATRLS